jgi:uncharacterized protein (TIGR00255 family)
MVKSMTGFASASGEIDVEAARFAYRWELRAGNGRGLDLRLRLPEGVEGLEVAVRPLLAGAVARGSVTLSLRLARADRGAGLRLAPATLDAALELVAAAEARALERGLQLAPMTAGDLLGLRGVLETDAEPADPAPLVAALAGTLDPLLAEFDAARTREGAALRETLAARVGEVERLTAEARALAESRRDDQAEALRAALARLGEAAPTVDAGRLEQELALIAIRSDLTEELDRLEAHAAAARAHLAGGGPVGRKLDFLMQEFNREANTLCAKSQHAPLTRIGLDLKTVIDQMREQVQNVE